FFVGEGFVGRLNIQFFADLIKEKLNSHTDESAKMALGLLEEKYMKEQVQREERFKIQLLFKEEKVKLKKKSNELEEELKNPFYLKMFIAQPIRGKLIDFLEGLEQANQEISRIGEQESDFLLIITVLYFLRIADYVSHDNCWRVLLVLNLLMLEAWSDRGASFSRYYAEKIGMPPKELAQLEKGMLKILDYRLCLTPEEFLQFEVWKWEKQIVNLGQSLLGPPPERTLLDLAAQVDEDDKKQQSFLKVLTTAEFSHREQWCDSVSTFFQKRSRLSHCQAGQSAESSGSSGKTSPPFMGKQSLEEGTVQPLHAGQSGETSSLTL
ncbi:MAG: hypothetical protein ACD_44C00415G0001, partial [uncultured bacterium]